MTNLFALFVEGLLDFVMRALATDAKHIVIVSLPLESDDCRR